MSKVNRQRTKPVENRRRHSKNEVSMGGSLQERIHRFFRGLLGQDRVGPIAIGAILVAVALFFVFAFISYLIDGANDQSVLLDPSMTTIEQQAEAMQSSSGVVGMGLMNTLVNEWVGIGIIFVIMMVALSGIGLLGLRKVNYAKVILFSSIATFWTSLFCATTFRGIAGWFFFYPGGILGETMYQWLVLRLGSFGVWLTLILTLLLSLFLFFQFIRKGYNNWVNKRGNKKPVVAPKEDLDDVIPPIDPDPVPDSPKETVRFDDVNIHKEIKEEPKEIEEESEEEPTLSVTIPPTVISTASKPKSHLIPKDSDVGIVVNDNRSMEEEVSTSELKAKQLVEEQGEYDPRRELSHFEMPHADLLKKYEQQNDEIDLEEIEENKRLITSTLQSFRIGIKSISATVGPAITLYEVVPEEGIHISRIRRLEDNISMDLSAMGIRIIAPIPGKGTIGMEVPNKNPQVVSMRSVILSKKFTESKAALPVALGRTITNDVFVFDLAKTPHLLVAGATGQGKSVGLNAIITSLLYKLHPSELKFVMIDPKMVEFSLYSLIEKHYMAKLPEENQVIITDPKRVMNTLESLCVEMDNRYELLSTAHVRNIREYNQKFRQRLLNPALGHKFLPYIVLIIDEYGDLMLTGGKEIESPITRLAQKARAVGIHAIIATQRPMASIITGAIKANFPGRLAFKVSSGTDSRIILDTTGANRLIGRGDSLFTTGTELTRVQCAFVDTPEVNNLVEFIGRQQGYSGAYELPEVAPEESSSGGTLATGELDPNERDELFEAVARRIVADKRPSASYIQQIFGVGYNRASRLMVQLEYAGIIAPQDGNKARELLVTTEEQLERILYP